jgi:MSHA biogenesis protein MshI
MECRVFGLLRKSSAAKGRIGIAFESDRVAVAVAVRAGDRTVLERCEVLTFDPAGGADAAAAVIRSAGLPRMPVSIVLRPEDYQLVLVEAPDVPPAELRAAMRWRLKDSIDFRVEDAVIDVFDVPPQSRGGVGRMMYAVAARRAAVERCAAALAAAPLFDVVDVPELCLRNLASRMSEAAGGVALLHLGETSASVILVRGTTFYFSRQTELRPVPASRADADAKEAAQLDSDAIVLELQRSLDYYERHFDQPPISRIAISPLSDRSRALAAALNRDTGFDVSALDLNTLLGTDAPIEPSVQAACLMAVGAAIREERRTL